MNLMFVQFPIEWWVKYNFTIIINNVTAFQKAYPLKKSVEKDDFPWKTNTVMNKSKDYKYSCEVFIKDKHQ